MRTLRALSVLLLASAVQTLNAEDAIHIGSRLELFVDDGLIETMSGGARLHLHRPTRREIVFKTDALWEGNASAFQSVFKDGDLYRMYYRGLHYAHGGKPARAMKAHPWFLCYAESDDGIHWRRPELGIFEFNGSRANNIVLTPDSLKEFGGDPAHTAAFKDSNPDCPAAEKYKIVVVGKKPHGLYILASADGHHFSLLTKKPFVTRGDFDSQNVAFWDGVRQEYREYHRAGRGGRDIMTSSGKTFDAFSDPQFLEYPGAPKQELYTNQVQPYYRAPHIFMGFPMRYQKRGWADSIFELPGKEERMVRGEAHPRYAMALTDAVFMSSRDAKTFKRWPEAFIRPGPRKRHSWVYGDNFIFWGMLETKSDIEDAPNEISLYATDSYWEGTCTSIRRYTVRIDGFVSAAAPLSGGEIVTKPLVFEGGNLAVNFETSAAGSVRVEIQDAAGKPIKGYTLENCTDIIGDHLRYIVRWSPTGGDVRSLAGKPIRLRFVLSDADLYSFQFVPYQPDVKRPDVSQFGIPKLPPKTGTRKPFVALEDDFQNAPSKTSPTINDLNPSHKAWIIKEGNPDRVQILNDEPVGSGKKGRNHYMKIERRDEPGLNGGAAWIWFHPKDATETQNGTVLVSARIYVPSSNKTCVSIDTYDNKPPWGCDRPAFRIRFFPDGSVRYYAKKQAPIPGLKLKLDSWQDVSIKADMKNATCDVTVSGKTATGIPFGTNGLHRLMTVCFRPVSNNAVLYIDQVKVEVIP